MEIVIIIVVVILFIVGAVLGHQQAKKRQQELSQWAATRGLAFHADRDHEFDGIYPEFSRLQQGSNRYAYNIIEGRYNKFAFNGFDYHYETHSTDSKGRRQTSHHHFSAVIVEADLPLKPLSIREEGFFDKIGEFLGFDDIDFELAEFSRAFHVKSPDRKWAFDVLHQQAMEFLLNSPRYNLDFQPGRIMACQGSTFSTADYEGALDVVTGLIELLPSSVLRELKEGT